MIKSSLLVVGANHRSSTAAMRRRMKTGLCRVIVEERASLAKRLTKAHKQGVRCVAIMGEDELRDDSVTWRDFKTGKQQLVPCSQVTLSLPTLLGTMSDD